MFRMCDYIGLASEAWDHFCRNDKTQDVALFLRLFGEHAFGRSLRVLDIGCGTGRVMIPLLCAGHAVDGIDISDDQIARCRANLAAAGLSAVVEVQSAEDLAMPGPYDAVLIPCGTIQLVGPPAVVEQVLRRSRAHLAPAGLLVLVMYLEGPIQFDSPQIGQWVLRARREIGQDVCLEKHARVDWIDWVAQVVTLTLWYRKLRAAADSAQVIEEQVVQVEERWYGAEEMTLMLARAGFDSIRCLGGYGGTRAAEPDRTLVLVAAAGSTSGGPG